MIRFVTLYVVLVLTSAAIITVALGAHPLAALGTASVGSLFKTVAAALHNAAWDRFASR